MKKKSVTSFPTRLTGVAKMNESVGVFPGNPGVFLPDVKPMQDLVYKINRCNRKNVPLEMEENEEFKILKRNAKFETI